MDTKKEYQTFSITLNGIDYQTELLPIHIKTIDYKLYENLIKFIKKYNKNNDKYVFDGYNYNIVCPIITTNK